MTRNILLLILILSVFSLWAQPQIQCLTVGEANGSVSVKYSGPPGTDYFNIYRASQLNGTYELIHTAPTNQNNTYLDNEINAASQSYSYYVESFDNDQSTGESQKVRTLFLVVNDLANGLVQLDWNDPGYEPSFDYDIWVKSESGIYDIHGSAPQNQYVDTIKACSLVRYYQVRVILNGCESVSNLRGGSFSDIRKPDPIITRNATIDINTGLINLSWLPPNEANGDIVKYQIWIINEDGGSTSFPEAEVYGINNLSINIENDFVCDTTITFAVTAQDSCNNSSDWDQSEYHIRTLNLHSTDYNICNDECEIKWDSILGWYDLELEGIRVYRKDGNGSFYVAEEVAPTETSAKVYGFDRGVEYQFYIEAYSAGNIRISTSCAKKITGRKPEVTAYTWLRKVSVEDGEVKLKWQVDSVAYIPGFAISRSTDGVDFDVIDSVENVSDIMHYYSDKSSRYYASPQYYYIQPFDSCYNWGEPSNQARSIYATVSSYADGEALIEWTPYELMDSILYYQIYRIIDTLVYPFPVGEVEPTTLSYVDVYDNAVPLTAKVGYYVEAIGYFSDSMPEADTIRSNTNYLAKVSQVFLPSGFQPKGGVTSEFKPIYTGIKNSNYSFKVLNRWGMMIFETNIPVEGWDGKYDGDYVMPGAYVYVVDYETLYGKKMRKSGIFYVLF